MAANPKLLYGELAVTDITLRDMFAAAALTAIGPKMVTTNDFGRGGVPRQAEYHGQGIAQIAYGIADAMLAEREK